MFKKEESKVEIINDINKDLVTLYRVIQHHLEEFIRYLKWILVAREEFSRFKAENPDTLTDIQRAVRFYYLLRAGYGAKVVGQTFNIGPTRPSSLNLLRIEEELSEAHLRLSRVYIENMHYQKLIERFDRPETFFYIDPPYYGNENDYGEGIFNREDFARLRDVLAGIQGRFIVSINDVREIRELFKDYSIEEVTTSYKMPGANKQKKVTELLVGNYVP